MLYVIIHYILLEFNVCMFSDQHDMHRKKCLTQTPAQKSRVSYLRKREEKEEEK